jgi:hypothetical protein
MHTFQCQILVPNGIKMGLEFVYCFRLNGGLLILNGLGLILKKR